MNPEQTGLLISDMLGHGRSLAVIIARSGWSKYEITQIAEANGYTFDREGAPHKNTAKTAAAGLTPTQAIQAIYDDNEPTPFIPSPTPKPDQRERITIDLDEPPATGSTPTAELTTTVILRGLESPHPKIRTLAAKASAAVNTLADALAVQDTKDHAAAAKQLAEAAARAKIKRLEAELAEARAVLRPTTATRNKGPAPAPVPGSGGRGHVSVATAILRAEKRAVREWARANGFSCADTGYISPKIVDAYERAHPTPVAG